MNLLYKLTRRRPHIRVNVRRDQPWLTIVGPNGRALLHSECYATLSAARFAARRLAEDTGWAIKDQPA